MRRKQIRLLVLLLCCWLLQGRDGSYAQSGLLSIGAIQGESDASPYLNQYVSFSGIVTGQYEDQNTRGIVYYTVFVQESPEASDGDPATSDAIAIFLGQTHPYVNSGDRIVVSGRVTEFFGLTEIDDDDLLIAVESRGETLPAPVAIEPPADMAAQRAYFEALESMRVTFDGEAVVSGPTHEGCGFAVIAVAAIGNGPPRVVRRSSDDPAGQIVPILYPSDLDCRNIPQVKTGDRLSGIAGPLVYNFDEFKIVLVSLEGLTIEPVALQTVEPKARVHPSQLLVVSINAEDYFDTEQESEGVGEIVLTSEDLAARQAKLAHSLGVVLGCPTLVGFQEVEHEALLRQLAIALETTCGFVYEVSHLESPDERGIDNALLSDPQRVTVSGVSLRQTCSPVPTGIGDAAITCAPGEEPLFGRPPLQVDVLIDGQAYTLFVNHFKSKRGGEVETGLERIRQAAYLNELASTLLDADPQARVIAMGDFNDTELSPAMALLTDPAQGGRFYNAMAAVPAVDRYSYIFSGVAELIDGILLSPALADQLYAASLLHLNADYPLGWRLDTVDRLAYRVSDHDIPIIVLGVPPEATRTATATSPVPTPTPAPSPVPSATSAQPTPTARPSPTPTAAAPSARTNPSWLVIGGVAVLIIVAMIAVWRRR